jgi:hypothetical protein
MTEAKKTAKDFYTENLYKSLIKRAEKSKYNGFIIPTLTKPDLLAVIGDLIDVNSMADERIDVLENDNNLLRHDIGVMDKQLNELIENQYKNTDTITAEDVETDIDLLNAVSDSDNVGNGVVGSIDGMEIEVVEPAPVLKDNVRRPIEKPKTQISAESLNTGEMGSHQYSDWN